ncbi:hypothetical protein RA28_02235 [Ruegeria sp. ANG-S4]|uniref:hypothetical protein n=1 Tax=Ruegeria sp. ANG-S4 TaxID=1577904 RepID=UPI00057D6EBB|nr:hypothetical protein [Ruegeria sp. ANG-S4]KIC46623.1 hypothetical protein RA28_02235 [Ruegeria sp. ANG-S4]
MNSDTSFKEFLTYVEDETIVSSLAQINDVEMRIDALAELLRDRNEVDTAQYHNEIRATFSIFYKKIEAILPGEGREQLWEFALPDLHLSPPQSKPKQSTWEWPVINLAPPKGSGLNGGTFRDFSALKMFDYTAGKTNGWPKSKRERFLNDFLRLELPEAVTQLFGNEYGSPMSTTRLRKIANLIASNCQLRIRNDAVRYRYAISDWESDLQFLKRTFYEGEGLKFVPWPDPRDI